MILMLLVFRLYNSNSKRKLYLSPQEEEMRLIHLTCVAICLCSVSAILKLNETNSPIVSLHWGGKSHVTGSHLIAPIRLLFLENICNQLISNIQISTDFLGTLVSSEVLTKAVNDLGFIRRISFIIHKVENTYVEIINYLENSLLCSNSTLIQLSDVFDELKNHIRSHMEKSNYYRCGKTCKYCYSWIYGAKTQSRSVSYTHLTLPTILRV